MSDFLRPESCIGTEQLRSKILPLRRRTEVRNGWLKDRLEGFLPKLMSREGFDMWIVICREYNEDPVYLTLVPEPTLSARRRSILLFTLREDQTLEKLTLARTGLADFYEGAWDPAKEDQYTCLGRLVKERNPKSIGINVSDTFAFGDGLTHNEYKLLSEALGPDLMARTRSAERVAVGWLEHRTKAEIDAYPGIVEIAHAIVSEAFSSRVIHPGITTTDDVVWWMRQRVLDLGMESWFQPSVSIQAHGMASPSPGSGTTPQRKLILPGDLLHCDFGIHYLGLATDTQQHAYILKHGESDAPIGLKTALSKANRLQDIVVNEMAEGKTGNEVLLTSLEKAKAEGINPSIYCHPIGYHGHGAGPLIGLWDVQTGVPGRGDYEIFNDAAHSIELNIKDNIPEWGGQEVRIALEQDIIFTSRQGIWLGGRQKSFFII